MRLIYVADNGFSFYKGKYYYSTPNYTHVSYMEKYFDEIVFFARKDNYDESCKIMDKGYSVYLFGKYDFFHMFKIMYKEIKKADVVIVYGLNGYLAQFIALRLRKTVIAYIGGDSKEALLISRNVKKQLLAPILAGLDKWKCSTADYVHYCAEFLFKRYPTRKEKLFCSGANIFIDEACLEKRLNRTINQPLVLGLIGYVYNYIKGIDIAIRAVALLNNDVDIELQIVGRGDTLFLEDLAKSLGVQKKIKFLGTKQMGEEMYLWLDNIDIYLQPSRSEGLPRATVEAMSRGCPVIASNVGALPELIDSEFIIRRGNHQKLAEKILKLSNDHSEMQRQSVLNFERAKDFKPEIREKKYDKFYGNIKRKV